MSTVIANAAVKTAVAVTARKEAGLWRRGELFGVWNLARREDIPTEKVR